MMAKNHKKNLIFSFFLSFFLCLSSCRDLNPYDFAQDFDSPTEVQRTGAFPLAGTETTFNPPDLTPSDCTYFVSPEGDDHDSGSENHPWASFQKAVDTSIQGDTTCFRGGTYTSGDIHISNSGTWDAMITFTAYPGETPILDGNGTTSEIIVLEGGIDYIRISGFVIRKFRIWGILLSGDNHYIHLDHLDIDGGEAGIRFTYADSAEEPPVEGIVENVIVEDSLIHGSQYSAVDCTPGPCNHMSLRHLEVFDTGLTGDAFYGSDGIEFARGQHVLVEDCYVHDNGGDGIDLGSRDREGHAQGVIVRRNRVVKNHLNGIKVWAGGRIENNVIWGSGDSAIWSGSFDCEIEIINNTVAFNMWDLDYSKRNWAVVIGYPEEVPEPEVVVVLVNNIFALNADPMEGGPTGVYLGPGVALTKESNNIFYSNPEEEITFDIDGEKGISREEISNGTWVLFSGQGLSDLTQDPIFVSGFPNPDLRLKSGSPAIDAGLTTFAPYEDIHFSPRDSAPDIGAYEY